MTTNNGDPLTTPEHRKALLAVLSRIVAERSGATSIDEATILAAFACLTPEQQRELEFIAGGSTIFTFLRGVVVGIEVEQAVGAARVLEEMVGEGASA